MDIASMFGEPCRSQRTKEFGSA